VLVPPSVTYQKAMLLFSLAKLEHYKYLLTRSFYLVIINISIVKAALYLWAKIDIVKL